MTTRNQLLNRVGEDTSTQDTFSQGGQRQEVKREEDSVWT